MKLTLLEKKKEIDNIYTFIFKPENKLNWTAGQYLIYSLDHENADLRGKQRFFTISSSPFEKLPSITTRISKNSSSFKKALFNLQIGEHINAKGPDGDFTLEKDFKNYVFIASGIGITPFISIIKELSYQKTKINISLIYANKSEKQILFAKELKNIAKANKEFKIKYILKPQQISSPLLKKYLDNKNIYYISGPDPMVEKVFEILKDLKVKEEKIRMDYFSGYKS